MHDVQSAMSWAPPRRRALPRAWWPSRASPVLAHGAIVTAALGCWVAALRGADVGRVSGLGLLAVLPAAYYVALALLACGFVAAAGRPRPSPVVLAAYVLAFAILLHATAAILYPEPRYTWTYKHLGVIDAIGAHGAADRSVDVYQNWPGFFALVAWFSRAAGVEPIDVARWAQPGFALADVAVVLFCLRGLTRDTRHVWTATWIFVIGDWIGQEYLAPQALGFLLVSVVVGVVLRWRPPVPEVAARGVRGLRRARDWSLRSGFAQAAPAGAWLPSRGAVLVGATASLAVIVSHQLSPVFLIAALTALTLVGPRPPPWALVAVIAAELWWVWLAWPFLAGHFDLLSFGPATGAQPAAALDHALPGASASAQAARAGVALVLALAVAGGVRRWRAGRRDPVPAALALVPWLVAVVQSYDGEGPLRAYLFALPWLAFFAASACRPAGAARTALRRSWQLGAATAGVAACTLFGYFGQGAIQVMSPADVAASRWFLDHAPPGATLTLVAPSFPDRLDRRYAGHLDASRALTDIRGLRGRRLGARDIPAIAGFLQRARGPRYLVLSPSQRRYARYAGLFAPGSFKTLAAALRESPRFRLVFRDGPAQVFVLRSSPKRGSAS
jgi:hypothetical protein